MEALILLWAVGNLFLQGFVFMKVWNWFPVELFGAPTIGLAGSMGLLLVAIFFRNINIGKKEETTEDRLKGVIFCTFLFAFVLLMGFILQAFI
ncbi:hypothetical protein M5X00_26215 [Paenibacillus alvei]|uniref:hypothetical protein n=1 Tax=Paenibacillus alvei TaxID=44250 RepID=UPI000289A3A3|nr:hypothetical protein [Paenibacillus alvei]EJW14105.1 hypothetical protein PAV_141p02110 [Paenibacillus alvei DSM 29]MCY9707746.1 hypothetical protein [Paenibacillus alvei]MCY9757727.1 hypothetical protein [Paenibacillus alvei]MEC0082741.1 hypothetical protein [Paenibacillus alvei]